MVTSFPTTLYYVRHCRPDLSCHDDMARPLTAAGRRDTAAVTAWLADKEITAIYSSPYRRAVDSISPFAASAGLALRLDPGLRERSISTGWIEDFDGYMRRQWEDFDYALPGGESLRQVQTRGLAAVGRILTANPGQNVALAGHGTALCAMLAYFIPDFGLADFERLRGKMPWGVVLRFDDAKTFSGAEEAALL